MKKILVVFGTRPEVIKLAPVIKGLKKDRKFRLVVCSTGQHNEMLEQMVSLFRIKVDYDLRLMMKNQNLYTLTSDSVIRIKPVIEKEKPDLVIVQGDTTTAFTTSLAAFYSRTRVAHIEAGLRSGNNYSPFPEEVNRKVISIIADYHFAPTRQAGQNLLKEGIDAGKILVTGNTVIDSVIEIKRMLNNRKFSQRIKSLIINETGQDLIRNKYILITMHRREKFGDELKKILYTLKELAEENPHYKFIYPVHLNPNVKFPVNEILSGIRNFILLPPVDYLSFIWLMKNCRFIISDSGGIQEECYIFKKPVIVLRQITERSEAIRAGYAFLGGHSARKIKNLFYILDKKIARGYNFFSKSNPFGDGHASRRIIHFIKNKLAAEA